MRIILEHTANSIFFFLGTVHTTLTLLNQRPFDLNALMYVGAGLAFIFLSFFNFVRVKTSHRLTKLFSLLSNILTAFYMVLVAVVFSDPRVTIAVVVLALLAVLSVIDYRKSANSLTASGHE